MKIAWRKKLPRRRGSTDSAGMMLTSLMDIFIVLVLYLLVNQGDGINLQLPDGVVLPDSGVDTAPRQSIVIALSDLDIRIQGEAVVSMAEVKASPLAEIASIRQAIERIKAAAKAKDQTGIDTEVTIVAGGDAPESVSAFTLVLMPRYAARGALSKRLEIRRQSAGAQLITLAYEDEDPALAASVLERLLREHREFIARTARGDAGATALELRRQIAQQQEKLSAAEEALRRFQERSGLVIPVEQGTAQIKRYATLRGELDALSVEHDALTRLLALVET